MADLAISFGATDIFALGGDFKAQNSSAAHSVERVVVYGPDGSEACSDDTVNGTTRYSATYKYCGTTLGTDLDAALLTNFGSVKDSKLVDTVGVTFSENDYPEITVTGHNHDVNAHATGVTAPATFNGSGIIPDVGGAGTVDILGIGDLASCVNATTVNFSTEHRDFLCGSADHASGITFRAMAEISTTYIGSVDENSITTPWTYESSTVEDSNDDIDKETITAYNVLTKN